MFYQTKLALAKFFWKHKMERASVSAIIKLQERHGGYIKPLIFKQAELNYKDDFTKVRHMIISDEDIKGKSIRELMETFPLQPTRYHNLIIRDYENIQSAIEEGVKNMQ